ncbi:YraN family protein [Simiduia curdlanivorans]|uniref:UPF0102 protein ACFOX3_14915 n=1 Tax=Simiduia curdlanivorans TaxID=1492769 RepID=A0ABV8V6S0_9GAMM|nr:YraN family protein [Simiduia curdlanivorans]MDN3638957.1 YraN family protein [Simiduia curdlanivorans]
MNTGAEAEQLAEQFLIAQGLRPIGKNFRCKGGELDLIMQHQRCTVFVEVRLRSNRLFASPLESVTLAKQKKLKLAAQHFLQEHPKLAQMACRFDVIAYNGLSETPEWIQAAFE